MRISIDPLRPAPRRLQPALDVLRRSGVIVYPTDTGYAYGCALSSPKGIARIRKLKGYGERDPKPLSMMVRDFTEIGRYGHMGNRVFRLVRRVLPGPYTLVLKATSEVPRGMRNRDHEVGLRHPDHRLCDMLLDLLGEPLLVGSLTSGDPTPDLEDPEDFEARLRSDVDLIIDAGPILPDPSTVLRLTDDDIEVLRVGQGPVPD